jgi:hypothetical protein
VEGPRNKDRERQNPDLVRPPSTDHGSMENMRWSFADSHVRIEVGLSTCTWTCLTGGSGGWLDATNNRP